MRQLVLTVAFVATLSWDAVSRVGSTPGVDWPRYRDEAHGIAFAYPPDLHPVVSSPDELRGLAGWVSRVVLVPDTPAHDWPFLTVSAFVCDEPSLEPRSPCLDEKYYRRVCDRFERFRAGNATALQCVSYGRGACHWSAVVLRRQSRVEIRSLAADHEANEHEAAHTRAACADAVVAARTRSPLKEVLASFEFRETE